MTWRCKSWWVIQQVIERLSWRMTKWVSEQTKVLKLQVRRGVMPHRARKACAFWNFYRYCFSMKTKKQTAHRNVDKSLTLDMDVKLQHNLCENLGSLKRTSYLLTALLCQIGNDRMNKWMRDGWRQASIHCDIIISNFLSGHQFFNSPARHLDMVRASDLTPLHPLPLTVRLSHG
jgi:hypothetical protein